MDALLDAHLCPPRHEPDSWPIEAPRASGVGSAVAATVQRTYVAAARSQGDPLMTRSPIRLALGAAILAVAAFASPAPAAAANDEVELASHRAVYDLKLADARGSRQLSAVRGRILYDFSGSSCEGYALQFRQVSELDNGEGKVVVSDLRATTWEEGAAKSYRFNFQNYLNEKLVDSVDGRAERGATPSRSGWTSRPQEVRRRIDRGVPDRAHAAHRAGRAGRQDAARSAGLRRLGDRREDLQHAHRDRAADRAGRAQGR